MTDSEYPHPWITSRPCVLGLALWTGELPMQVSVVALAALWLPYLLLNLVAGTALARGYMRIPETAHCELLTMEIYTRALRCAIRPGKTRLKVTPKQGNDRGGWDALRKLHLVLFCTALAAAGTLLRLLDLAGVGPLPDLLGIAAVIVPLLGLYELRRLRPPSGRSAVAASAASSTASTATPRPTATSPTPTPGPASSTPRPPASASSPTARSRSAPAVPQMLESAAGERRQVEVRSCREAHGRFLVGTTIPRSTPTPAWR